MPRPALLCVLLGAALAGCSASPAPTVVQAVVTGVTVEALPLDRQWDGAVSTDPPDVYVDLTVLGGDGPLAFDETFVRTAVAENATAADLPLRLAVGETAQPLPLRTPLRLSVADRDMGGLDTDDELFHDGPFRLAARVADARPGDTRALVFGDGETRVRVAVRWE
jgi:hypothetical protein